MKIDVNTRPTNHVGGINDGRAPAQRSAYKGEALSVLPSATLAVKNERDAGTDPLSARQVRSVFASAPSPDEAFATRRMIGQFEAPKAQVAQGEVGSSITHDSLIGTRILAMRSVLGEEANHIDDDNLLRLANQIHSKGHALLNVNGVRKRVEDALKDGSPEDSVAIELAERLLLEETRIWLDWDGGESSDEDVKRNMAVYSEMWDLTLNPPPAPAFKTRRDLAQDYITQNGLEPPDRPLPMVLPEANITVPQIPPRQTMAEFVSETADSAQIKKSYFQQVDSYINRNLGRLCTLNALASAQSAGISRKLLLQAPEKVWTIEQADRYAKGVPIAFIERSQSIPLLRNDDNRPVILQMPGNKVLLLGSNGSIKDLGPVLGKDGNPSAARTMAALVGSADLEATDRARWEAALSSQNYGFTTKLQTGYERLTLKSLIEIKHEKHLSAALKGWQNENYEASGLYGLARTLIPFFQVIEDSQNNPGFELKFEDIALDVLDLGITLATIALSAGTGTAAAAGARTFWSSASKGVGVALKTGTRAAIGTFKDGFRLGALLKTAGKELADFVVPVFSAADLGRAGLRAAGSGLGAARRELSEGARLLLATRVAEGQDLTRGAAAGARSIKLPEVRPLERYAVYPQPTDGRESGKGLIVVGANEYAKVDENFYRVAKDHASSTNERPIWKIRSPDDSRNISLDVAPIRLEFKDGNWKLVNDPPRLLGGAPVSLSSNDFGQNFRSFLADNPVVNMALGSDLNRDLRIAEANTRKQAWVAFVKNDAGNYDFRVYAPPYPEPNLQRDPALVKKLAGIDDPVSRIPAYWVPDKGGLDLPPGFVDIPKTNPDMPYVFTGGMNGCALVVTQAPDPSNLRVWHVRNLSANGLWDSMGVQRDKAMIFDVSQYHHEGEMTSLINRLAKEKKEPQWSALNFLVFEGDRWKIVSATNAVTSPHGGRAMEALRVGHVVEVPVNLPG